MYSDPTGHEEFDYAALLASITEFANSLPDLSGLAGLSGIDALNDMDLSGIDELSNMDLNIDINLDLGIISDPNWLGDIHETYLEICSMSNGLTAMNNGFDKLNSNLKATNDMLTPVGNAGISAQASAGGFNMAAYNAYVQPIPQQPMTTTEKIILGALGTAIGVVAIVATGGAAAPVVGSLAASILAETAIGYVSGSVGSRIDTGSWEGANTAGIEYAKKCEVDAIFYGGLSLAAGGLVSVAGQSLRMPSAFGSTTTSVAEGTGNIIQTPYGKAIQASTDDALKASSYVDNGGELYRGGTFGRSNVTDAQFWAPENPLNPGYAERYGVDFNNVDYIIGGKLNPGSQYITRPAPTLGTNAGGNVEIVTNPNSVKLDFFYMP